MTLTQFEGVLRRNEWSSICSQTWPLGSNDWTLGCPDCGSGICWFMINNLLWLLWCRWLCVFLRMVEDLVVSYGKYKIQLQPKFWCADLFFTGCTEMWGWTSPNPWGTSAGRHYPVAECLALHPHNIKSRLQCNLIPFGFTGTTPQPQAVYFLDQSIFGCQNKLKAILKSVAQCKLGPNFETSEFWKNRNSVHVPQWKNRCYGIATPFLTLTAGPWIRVKFSLTLKRKKYLLNSLQPLSSGQRGRLRPPALQCMWFSL